MVFHGLEHDFKDFIGHESVKKILQIFAVFYVFFLHGRNSVTDGENFGGFPSNHLCCMVRGLSRRFFNQVYVTAKVLPNRLFEHWIFNLANSLFERSLFCSGAEFICTNS